MAIIGLGNRWPCKVLKTCLYINAHVDHLPLGISAIKVHSHTELDLDLTMPTHTSQYFGTPCCTTRCSCLWRSCSVEYKRMATTGPHSQVHHTCCPPLSLDAHTYHPLHSHHALIFSLGQCVQVSSSYCSNLCGRFVCG